MDDVHKTKQVIMNCHVFAITLGLAHNTFIQCTPIHQYTWKHFQNAIVITFCVDWWKILLQFKLFFQYKKTIAVVIKVKKIFIIFIFLFKQFELICCLLFLFLQQLEYVKSTSSEDGGTADEEWCYLGENITKKKSICK
ncbi:hypothetical protein RFI_26577 [Reticulomyxa filosa]|uniref:Uncharacterized protein n=1 Tax=Reticulomyxa filosa TaxID=46433 RepID=X6MCN2_RETFI|nr:hypothetical protein RFI_26577 [Reticulomyxa filosa]|eukprot:ETO10800.1 hypothetical protein RFI_26577 [Reticulomyxa filosa]